MLRFCNELIARVDRAGASGPKLLRADSGFWAKTTFDRLHLAGWQFSIGVRMQPHIRKLVEAIPETAWTTLEDYPKTSIGQIAETRIDDFRMVVRRVRTLSQQGELLPRWEHYPFATNRTDELSIVEAEPRQHAVVELAIRDLEDQALAHLPSGNYNANAAWTVIAAIAHNLLRWTQKIALPDTTTRTARTLRRRLLSIPGRLARSGRRTLLRMPARWPWRHDFLTALHRIRALPPPT